MPVRVIQTERIGYERKETELILEKMDPESAFTVQRHVYYPYLFFEYMLNRKGFFHPLEGNIGCTVDGVNKIGALSDTFPRLEKKTVPRQAVIENTLELSDAKPIAENFLLNHIIHKKKILSIPKLHLTKQMVFYRPYWIVEGKSKASERFLLMVDAVSGKYHPLH